MVIILSDFLHRLFITEPFLVSKRDKSWDKIDTGIKRGRRGQENCILTTFINFNIPTKFLVIESDTIISVIDIPIHQLMQLSTMAGEPDDEAISHKSTLPSGLHPPLVLCKGRAERSFHRVLLSLSHFMCDPHERDRDRECQPARWRSLPGPPHANQIKHDAALRAANKSD